MSHRNKMLLKNSQSSMERLLSKITFIYQAIGFQAFSVNRESLESISGCSRKHKLFLVISLALLIGEICVVLLRAPLSLQMREPTGIKTGIVVQLISYSFIFLAILVSMFNNFFFRSKAKENFKNCFRIAEIVSVLNQVADYSYFANEFKLTMTKLFFSLLFSHTALIVFLHQYTNFWIDGYFALYTHFFITALVSYWTLLVRLIREIYDSLKNILCICIKNRKCLLYILSHTEMIQGLKRHTIAL